MKAVIDLEELLLTKDYQMLNPEEKEYVDRVWTQAEYEDQRAVITGSHLFFHTDSKEIKPHPRVKAALDEAFGARFRKPILHRILTYRVPLYQPGIAAAILLLFMIRTGREPAVVVRETPVIVYRTDTVRITEETRPVKAVASGSNIKSNNRAEIVSGREDNFPTQPSPALDLDESLARYGAGQTGRSLKEDSLLAGTLISLM
jgi:hypothetical protein